MNVKDTKTKLEGLKSDFNREVIRLVSNGESRDNLDRDFNDIVKRFVDRLRSVLRDLGLDYSSVNDSLDGNLSRITRVYYPKYTDGLIEEIIDELRRLNQRECNDNIELLEGDISLKEEIQEGVKRNSRIKEENAEDIRDSKCYRGRDGAAKEKEVEGFRMALDDLFSEIKSSASRSAYSRGMSDRQIEDKIYELRSEFRRIQENCVGDYSIALGKFLGDVLKEFNVRNTAYTALVEQTMGEVEREDSKPSNPFELSEDIKKKIVDVGRSAPKPQKEDRSDGLYIDFL